MGQRPITTSSEQSKMEMLDVISDKNILIKSKEYMTGYV